MLKKTKERVLKKDDMIVKTNTQRKKTLELNKEI